MAQSIDMVKVKKWRAMAEELSKLRDDEMALRREIVADLVGDVPKGSAKLRVNGMEINAKAGTTLSIDGDYFEDGYELLPEPGKACFIFKPSFSKTMYNQASAEVKAMVDALLVEKPAAPTLTVKDIKEK